MKEVRIIARDPRTRTLQPFVRDSEGEWFVIALDAKGAYRVPEPRNPMGFADVTYVNPGPRTIDAPQWPGEATETMRARETEIP